MPCLLGAGQNQIYESGVAPYNFYVSGLLPGSSLGTMRNPNYETILY